MPGKGLFRNSRPSRSTSSNSGHGSIDPATSSSQGRGARALASGIFARVPSGVKPPTAKRSRRGSGCGTAGDALCNRIPRREGIPIFDLRLVHLASELLTPDNSAPWPNCLTCQPVSGLLDSVTCTYVPPQDDPKRSVFRATRPNGQVQGECGIRETCHPKNPGGS
jgi:hypothetical protein